MTSEKQARSETFWLGRWRSGPIQEHSALHHSMQTPEPSLRQLRQHRQRQSATGKIYFASSSNDAFRDTLTGSLAGVQRKGVGLNGQAHRASAAGKIELF